MKFAVVALGSTGDLHPFLAIARALAARGHEVTLLTQAPYEDQVRAEGVDFRAVVGGLEHRKTLEHPLLWHPLHGFGVLWRHLAVPAIEATCETLGELASACECNDRLTVLATPIAAGARFARERWPDRIRLLSGYTAPMGLRSTENPMFVGPWRVPNWVPAALRPVLWSLLDRWKLEPMARPVLERWRARWQTSELSASIFGDWLHSPDGGLALYPDWFARVPAQWRERSVRQGNFPLFEPSAPQTLPVGVADFIARHPRYIVVYSGSAASQVQRFMDLVAPACEQLNLAAIFLTPHLQSGSQPLKHHGAQLLTATQLPLKDVLPDAQAFVHHGGIGSLAQGFRHAIPQLVLAAAYDQFENGARLELLGAGRWHIAARCTPAMIASDLRNLVNRPTGSPRRPNITAKYLSPTAAVENLCDLLIAVD